jgi:hypothetical protein
MQKVLEWANIEPALIWRVFRHRHPRQMLQPV